MSSYAFVNGVLPVAKSGFVGRSVTKTAVVKAAEPVARKSVVVMVKSKAMPFMEAPKALDGKGDGGCGFAEKRNCHL